MARCGSFETMGRPVGDIAPPTTQLLLPSSATGSSDAARFVCTGAIPRSASSTSGRGSGPAARVAATTRSSISETSSPFGTVSSSHGSGAARRLASLTPYFATSMANRSSPVALPNAGSRNATVSAVHSSGVMPVIVNSTGSLSAWVVMKALMPLA